MGRTREIKSSDEIRSNIVRLETELSQTENKDDKHRIRNRLCYWRHHLTRRESQQNKYAEKSTERMKEKVKELQQKIEQHEIKNAVT